MGILGMLIFVPLFSVLYALSEEYVVKSLRDKGISWKKYNMACNIPEGRWNGRLNEKCVSEVHRADAGKAGTDESNMTGGTAGSGNSGKTNTGINSNRNKNYKKRK